MATINSLKVKLKKLGNTSTTESLTKACLLVEDSAKAKAPVNTGTLRNSITYEVEGDTGIIGTNLEYAPYVHEGTGLFAASGDGRTDVPWKYQTADGSWHSTLGQNPQPFLREALDENKSKIIELFTKTIKETLK